MHPFSIFLAALVAFSTLLASALAEPIPKSGAVQAAKAREVDAIGPPWHSEDVCCRPGCTWCGFEPCSINNCNMPVSFPFDICCALSFSKKRDVNGVPLHAYNQAGELVTFVSSVEVLASTPSAAHNIEPTPATTIVTKSDLADSAPAAASQLEERIRIENWCCLSNCGRCRNQQCLQVQCSWPYNTCCEIDVFKKRDDDSPMQAFNKAGEAVIFVSEVDALAELDATPPSSTMPTTTAELAPIATAQLEERIRIENWCCLSNCGRCLNRQCLRVQCSWPYDTCCEIDVFKKRDLDGLPMQAFNKAGEPVTFISDAGILVELPSTFTTSTTTHLEPTSAATALVKPRDIDALGPPWTYQDQVCCRPGCGYCGWSRCQHGCAWEPFLNTCCFVSVAEGKRDGPVQAWNQNGEPVIFISDLVTTRRQELEIAALQDRER